MTARSLSVLVLTTRVVPQHVAIDAGGAIRFHVARPLADALRVAETMRPDLMVIDADSSFPLFLQLFRSARGLELLHHVPILASFQSADPDAIARAIDAGVDDCLTADFCSAESIARIRAATRRVPRRIDSSTIRLANLVLDKTRLKAWHNGRPIALTVFQLRLLEFLMTHPGQVFSRRQLLEQVWGTESTDTGAVTACIARIRRALGQEHGDGLIRSVRGAGYALEADPQADHAPHTPAFL